MKFLPKAIIFDWDNTIIDTLPMICDSIDQTMIKMGKKPWGIDKVKKNSHRSMREYFPEVFGNDWKIAGKSFRKHAEWPPDI